MSQAFKWWVNKKIPPNKGIFNDQNLFKLIYPKSLNAIWGGEVKSVFSFVDCEASGVFYLRVIILRNYGAVQIKFHDAGVVFVQNIDELVIAPSVKSVKTNRGGGGFKIEILFFTLEEFGEAASLG